MKANNRGVLALKLLGGLCLLNAVVIGAVGVATLMGNRLIFEAGGIGPDRIAVASLFGPFANHAGWILLVISLGAGILGAGFLRGRDWARLTLMGLVVIAVMAAVAAMIWAGRHGEWATVAWGGVKVALYVCVLCILRARRLRSLFS
jgi:hypothetical protein